MRSANMREISENKWRMFVSWVTIDSTWITPISTYANFFLLKQGHDNLMSVFCRNLLNSVGATFPFFMHVLICTPTNSIIFEIFSVSNKKSKCHQHSCWELPSFTRKAFSRSVKKSCDSVFASVCIKCWFTLVFLWENFNAYQNLKLKINPIQLDVLEFEF